MFSSKTLLSCKWTSKKHKSFQHFLKRQKSRKMGNMHFKTEKDKNIIYNLILYDITSGGRGLLIVHGDRCTLRFELCYWVILQRRYCSVLKDYWFEVWCGGDGACVTEVLCSCIIILIECKTLHEYANVPSDYWGHDRVFDPLNDCQNKCAAFIEDKKYVNRKMVWGL